jgi:hypothetical protein
VTARLFGIEVKLLKKRSCLVWVDRVKTRRKVRPFPEDAKTRQIEGRSVVLGVEIR